MSRPTSLAARFSQRDGNSNGSSRSSSRVRTPNPDGEENGALDINFSGIEELLSRKLESLQAIILQNELEDAENKDSMVANAQDYREKHVSAMNKMRIQSESTTVNEIIDSLGRSRSEVSSQSRKMLLAQLYKLIVIRPLVIYNEENAGTPNYVSEEKVLQLVKLLNLKEYRSSSEFILLFRSIIGLLASDLEDFGEIVSVDFHAKLESLISEPPNASVNEENKAGVISGYCALLIVLYADNSAFGVDDKVKWLMELAQGYVQSSVTLQNELKSGDREYSTLMDESDDKRLVSEQEANVQAEANIAVAAIHGVAGLLTLLPRGEYLNEILTNLATEFVEIVDNDVNMDIAKAGGRALALCYELYTYEEGEDEAEDEDDEFNYNAPYYEQEALLSTCNRLASVTAKKVGKKEKKDTTTVFSQLYNTIKNYTNPETREEIYKRSLKGLELLNEGVSTTAVKLSRTKTLPINSWFLYFRLLHLKWCFGFGLHDQLVHNPEIRDILKEPSTKYSDKYGGNDDLILGSENFGLNAPSDVDRFARSEKKRANDLKKARQTKLTEELEDLGIKD